MSEAPKGREVYEFTLDERQFAEAVTAYFIGRGLLPVGAEFEMRKMGEPETHLKSYLGSHVVRDFWTLQFWRKS